MDFYDHSTSTAKVEMPLSKAVEWLKVSVDAAKYV